MRTVIVDEIHAVAGRKRCSHIGDVDLLCKVGSPRNNAALLQRMSRFQPLV